MFTAGTQDENDIPRIIQEFLSKGYSEIQIKQDSYGQWIIRVTG